MFGSALFAVVSIFVSGYINASLIGLSVAYSLRVTQTLNWMVRMSCEIESQIISGKEMKNGKYIELGA